MATAKTRALSLVAPVLKPELKFAQIVNSAEAMRFIRSPVQSGGSAAAIVAVLSILESEWEQAECFWVLGGQPEHAPPSQPSDDRRELLLVVYDAQTGMEIGIEPIGEEQFAQVGILPEASYDSMVNWPSSQWQGQEHGLSKTPAPIAREWGGPVVRGEGSTIGPSVDYPLQTGATWTYAYTNVVSFWSGRILTETVGSMAAVRPQVVEAHVRRRDRTLTFLPQVGRTVTALGPIRPTNSPIELPRYPEWYLYRSGQSLFRSDMRVLGEDLDAMVAAASIADAPAPGKVRRELFEPLDLGAEWIESSSGVRVRVIDHGVATTRDGTVDCFRVAQVGQGSRGRAATLRWYCRGVGLVWEEECQTNNVGDALALRQQSLIRVSPP